MSMVDIAKRLAEEPPDLKGYFALTDDIIHIILNKVLRLDIGIAHH